MNIQAFRMPAAAAALLASLALATVAVAGGDWNETGVAWKTYDAGIAEAKASNKPVCLIIYTDWCPHCTNYSKLFHDPAMVEMTKKFVMIHINKDKETAVSSKYAPDGEYIPRTIFLKPDGTLLDKVTADRAEYKYFYSESDPQAVMKSMNAVLASSDAK